MIALFNDVAVLHQQNIVRIHDGGQTVRNDEAGSVFHQSLHSLTDLDLRPGIHGRCGFVQNEDHRVAEEHSGNG